MCNKNLHWNTGAPALPSKDASKGPGGGLEKIEKLIGGGGVY